MNYPDPSEQPKAFKDAVKAACGDSDLIDHRFRLIRSSAATASHLGKVMHVRGVIVGPDRAAKASPFQFGSDEAVGVATLLRILSQLNSAIAECFTTDLVYAGSAMLRQLVEVEYLGWAMDNRHKDAERWLRSSSRERQDLFKPAKLRKAAGETTFRSVDYSFHCDHGGHPTPHALLLLEPSVETTQLFAADTLGHTGRVWDHLANWAKRNNESLFVAPYSEMATQFMAWKAVDLLAHLPAPDLAN